MLIRKPNQGFASLVHIAESREETFLLQKAPSQPQTMSLSTNIIFHTPHLFLSIFLMLPKLYILNWGYNAGIQRPDREPLFHVSSPHALAVRITEGITLPGGFIPSFHYPVAALFRETEYTC